MNAVFVSVAGVDNAAAVRVVIRAGALVGGAPINHQRCGRDPASGC
jgi:hypothetical protein